MPVQVSVKYLSGQEKSFTVEPTDTIGSLIEKAKEGDIVAELSEEAKPFKLACWPLRIRELDVTKTFASYGIKVRMSIRGVTTLMIAHVPSGARPRARNPSSISCSRS